MGERLAAGTDDTILQSVYQQAEQAGIADVFESWQKMHDQLPMRRI
jgi:hypothetical protein